VKHRLVIVFICFPAKAKKSSSIPFSCYQKVLLKITSRRRSEPLPFFTQPDILIMFSREGEERKKIKKKLVLNKRTAKKLYNLHPEPIYFSSFFESREKSYYDLTCKRCAYTYIQKKLWENYFFFQPTRHKFSLVFLSTQHHARL
jgi:hypothetical protein